MHTALKHDDSCIAYGVGFMNGVGGLQAWRWLFILEGIPSGEKSRGVSWAVSHSELIPLQLYWGYSYSCSYPAIQSNALGLLQTRRLFKQSDLVRWAQGAQLYSMSGFICD